MSVLRETFVFGGKRGKLGRVTGERGKFLTVEDVDKRKTRIRRENIIFLGRDGTTTDPNAFVHCYIVGTIVRITSYFWRKTKKQERKIAALESRVYALQKIAESLQEQINALLE